MTYRQKIFELKKIQNKYLTNLVIRSLLIDDGGFIDYTELFKHIDEEIKDENRLNKQLERVMSGEPYQYVLGYAYFINSNYKVTPDVLIPRQETEQLAMTALIEINKYFKGRENLTIVDVGTGSGILAIYLKENLKSANVIGIDISENCLKIAEENANLHNVYIDFRCGNMLDPIKEKIDVIISNPPYIESEDTVAEETLKYEPHLALFASPKTKYYEEILSNMDKMNKEFFIAFEIGEDMKEDLTRLIEEKYKGVGYSFAEDIYYKTRFLYIYKFKELDRYE